MNHKKITFHLLLFFVITLCSIGLTIFVVTIHEGVHVLDADTPDFACISWTPHGSETISQLSHGDAAGITGGQGFSKHTELKAYTISTIFWAITGVLVGAFLLYYVREEP